MKTVMDPWHGAAGPAVRRDGVNMALIFILGLQAAGLLAAWQPWKG